jgi:iron-sulfur cluster insertion protein
MSQETSLTTTPCELRFSNTAAEKICIIIQQQTLPFFRIKIQGGGCMGFEFVFGLDGTQSTRDYCWEQNATTGRFKCLIDHISYSYLKGAEIDFIDDANGQRFIVNSQYAQTCSCNKSFSIESQNDHR